MHEVPESAGERRRALDPESEVRFLGGLYDALQTILRLTMPINIKDTKEITGERAIAEVFNNSQQELVRQWYTGDKSRCKAELRLLMSAANRYISKQV